jgi:epoxyqueuosine reductase
LLTASDVEIVATWGRWYLAERDPRWIRRNALVVLGNIGDPCDPQVRTALGSYVGGPDAMLRVHAVWAARQLGLVDLLPDADPDPDVAAELASA